MYRGTENMDMGNTAPDDTDPNRDDDDEENGLDDGISHGESERK